jgi:hypothetical protein
VRRVEALSQREQAGEALGELERADNQHQTADVGHAARGDGHCRRIGDEDGGDSERQLCVTHRQVDPRPHPEEPAQQASRRMLECAWAFM